MKEFLPFTIYSSSTDEFGGRLKGYNILVNLKDDLEIRDIYYKLRDHLRSKGVTPLTIYPSETINGKSILFMVVDREDKSEAYLERLIRKLPEEIPGIKSVEEARRFRNIIYSYRLFPIVLISNRWILMGPASIRTIACDLREEVGDKVAEVLLTLMGRKVGEETYDYYKSLGKFEKITDALEFLKMILYMAGWTILEEYEVERNIIFMRFVDLWECWAGKESRACEDKPYFFMGAVMGFFSKVFNEEVKVKLISKRVVGERIHCIIQVSRHSS